MKTFKSFQELWSNCLYCSICTDVCRTISITGGPDINYSLEKWDKKENILRLFYKPKAYHKDIFIFKIDCPKNTFVHIYNHFEVKQNLYFFIDANCPKCQNTYANSTDIELDWKTETLINVGLEREGIILDQYKDKYHIIKQYNDNRMYIEKYDERGDGNYFNLGAYFPIMDIDFSKPKKALNKIKTILTYG